MKVILLERVEGWGGLGDVVDVKDGYARNFLLPRSKALRANAANLKVFERPARRNRGPQRARQGSRRQGPVKAWTARPTS